VKLLGAGGVWISLHVNISFMVVTICDVGY